MSELATAMLQQFVQYCWKPVANVGFSRLTPRERQRLITIATVMLTVSLFPSPTLAQLCISQLNQGINAIIDQPQFARARWGVLVQTLSPTAADRQTLYSRDARRFFIPASMAKLFTTAAALDQLGAGYRIRTSVYGAPSGTGYRLQVVGRGDPSFSDRHLQQLAEQLKRRGVQRVSQLWVDDSYLRGSAIVPSWAWEDVQLGYGPPVNSLILNENVVGLQLQPTSVGEPLAVAWTDADEGRRWQVDNQSKTVSPPEPEILNLEQDPRVPRLYLRGQLLAGSDPADVAVSVLEPASYFLRRLRATLMAVGIRVDRAGVLSSPNQPSDPELAFTFSPPIAELITTTNQLSNNLYAEALLRQLGATQSPNRDATQAGLDRLRTALTRLGVDPSGYLLADGSGLSRHNLVSPEAVVQLLQSMAMSPQAMIYRKSLAMAGQTGTLAGRFQGTVVASNLQGKTGTLSGVVALAGYLTLPNRPTLVFAIVVNQSEQSTATLRRALDDIVLLLGRLDRC
ncbi:MAG: D-alanyl-D-alanine carboxypeptidase/D-alanyl-D-alanine-endopeptidase [Cyanobacteria bacterium]|nr:D-alanyl-D-alanine carboxypeptidase/D-alanyl-D-alanine-endopeptidase [Cyanobacteriota bacterium]MDW8201644.1 D-alanyl-D-alanine carboxypeptidase/D-alanyl-D-alanine-endopeptidase [Cyanobacteriota bacterium SKYGB_h_bin112]